jgi:hypothetical protein
MFHPRGPNFLRSCTIAWKQHILNANFLNSSGFLQSLKNLSLRELRLPRRFALIPLGGSDVTFILFCRTDIGKYSQGIEVRNNLKSSWCSLSPISST